MNRVLSVLAAGLFLTATASFAATTSTGWISDSMCGAKPMGNGAACVKKCISKGQKPVFVDADKNVWKIDNPNAVSQKLYGAQVKIKATEDAASKSMHIDSIQAAK